MKVGDVIRLKQPFYPPPKLALPYRYGVIAGLIQPGGSTPPTLDAAEIMVNLYDPTTAKVYTDELGVEALYIFYPDEIDLA